MRSIKATFERLRIEDHSAEALSRLVEAGQPLHELVVEAADNDPLRRAYDILKSQAMLIRSITRSVAEIEHVSYEAHMKILDAVRGRRSEAAEQAMRGHLASTREGVIRYMPKSL